MTNHLECLVRLCHSHYSTKEFLGVDDALHKMNTKLFWFWYHCWQYDWWLVKLHYSCRNNAENNFWYALSSKFGVLHHTSVQLTFLDQSNYLPSTLCIVRPLTNKLYLITGHRHLINIPESLNQLPHTTVSRAFDAILWITRIRIVWSISSEQKT